MYRTRRSWSRRRRVVGKAELAARSQSPLRRRLVDASEIQAEILYEKLLRARRYGEQDRECQTGSLCRSHLTATMRANQLRLWLASLAYILLCAVRRIGLRHTAFSNVSCGTIRLKLLKIGAHVRITCPPHPDPRWPRTIRWLLCGGALPPVSTPPPARAGGSPA